MNVARLFAMGVGVTLLLMVLEGFRRQIMGMGLSRRNAVVFIAGITIGSSVAMYGFRELLSRRWIGVIWMLIGIGINYIVIRETWWQTEVWQKRVKGQKPGATWVSLTRTGRLMYLLGLVLLALLYGIIIMLSGRSDFSIPLPW
jgi:hypothetical protein